jgi:hypothetical protein
MKTDENGRYHLRRKDKAMPDPADQLAVIRGGKFLTLALCRDNEPYLVSLCYAHSEAERCFYVHSALQGKKLDFLRANQRVWGQILEDRGYVGGAATYAYRSVMFEGLAEFVEEPEAKRRALAALLERYEPGAEALKARMLAGNMVDKTAVVRLRVLALSGKQSPAPAAGDK